MLSISCLAKKPHDLRGFGRGGYGSESSKSLRHSVTQGTPLMSEEEPSSSASDSRDDSKTVYSNGGGAATIRPDGTRRTTSQQEAATALEYFQPRRLTLVQDLTPGSPPGQTHPFGTSPEDLPWLIPLSSIRPSGWSTERL
ncbi:hypothetical protein AVEN_263983-1 [Araneus ventricosus]|uniref:Uncharacterized protein n=1 Tax=Araneus ventricosus TaxID=182803 RepID=A0A4Y2T3E6_ARAVE|nr:hypothetical protein AVEN_263983-1 [Araneus ventricosus]